MHIEVFEGKKEGQWYWHFRNKGRVTADSEAFPSRHHATRAARSVVVACVRCVLKRFALARSALFSVPEWDTRRQCWVIRWE